MKASSYVNVTVAVGCIAPYPLAIGIPYHLQDELSLRFDIGVAGIAPGIVVPPRREGDGHRLDRPCGMAAADWQSDAEFFTTRQSPRMGIAHCHFR
jgi:hypothetical protein